MADKVDGKEASGGTTEVIDAYLARKGLAPRVDDATWQAVIEQVRRLFGRDLHYRCRRITQAHDYWRRFYRVFPDALRRPYRHLHHIEISILESPEMDELKRWLEQRSIEWQEERDPESGRVIGLKIYGFPSEVA